MNSLQDVADEVLYDEKWKIDRGEFFYPDELPEGHCSLLHPEAFGRKMV